MAPRTRSGKGLTIEEVAAHRKAMRAGPVNTTGFPRLPTEMLLEIVSHLPTVSFPCFANRPLDNTYLHRAQVIRTLSQMCKSLRGIFLPLAYERIEVCALPSIEPGQSSSAVGRSRQSQDKMLATDLVRQLEIVTIRDPSLARYVRVVNVMLTRISEDTIVEELFRCLPMFSNVHTVQLLSSRTSSPRYISPAIFTKLQFPSVKKLFLSPYAQLLTDLFPNAKEISSSTPRSYLHSISLQSSSVRLQVQDYCGLEQLPNQRFLFEDQQIVQDLATVFPKLQVLRFGISGHSSLEEITPYAVETASRIKELRTIVFHLEDAFQPLKFRAAMSNKPVPRLKANPKNPETLKLLVTALKVLQAKPQEDEIRRYVRVLSPYRHTIFALRVLQSDYVCEVDEVELLPLFQAAQAS